MAIYVTRYNIDENDEIIYFDYITIIIISLSLSVMYNILYTNILTAVLCNYQIKI